MHVIIDIISPITTNIFLPYLSDNLPPICEPNIDPTADKNILTEVNFQLASIEYYNDSIGELEQYIYEFPNSDLYDKKIPAEIHRISGIKLFQKYRKANLINDFY